MTDTSIPFDPTFLSSEATKPSTPTDLLAQLNAAPKRRGRPVGSRNRPKEDPGTPGMGMPPRAGETPKPKPDVDPVRLREAKKAKTDAYATRIVEELNDNIMSIFMGLGVPDDLIYKPGQAPIQTTVSHKYQPLGNALAIKPSQARAVASFLVELESSDGGAKIAATMSGGAVPLVIKGLMALAAIAQYANSLNQVRTQLQPMLEAYQRAQQEAQPNNNGGVGRTYDPSYQTGGMQ